MTRRHKKISSMWFYTVVVLAVIGAVAFFGYFTNGFKSGFNTFALSYGGKRITPNTMLTLPADEELRFDCKYMFSFLEDDALDYTVTITSNAGEDNTFAYGVNGDYIWFSPEEEFSELFNLQQYATHFTLKLDKDMYEILAWLHPGKVIDALEMDYSEQYYFRITVTPSGDRKPVVIAFRTNLNARARSLELDSKEIIF